MLFRSKISKVLGSEAQRIAALQHDADVYVINIENIVWLCERKEIKQFTNLVLDESHKWKEPSTRRFKSLKKHIKSFQRRVCLTGTPSPQTVADLWAQVGILDLGERLETSLTRFREKYLEPDQINRQTRVVYSWKPKPQSVTIIQQKIKDICFSLKAEDYLELPKLTKLYHIIDIDAQVRTQYDTFKKDMVTDFGAGVITASTAATLAGKLLQFTSGAVYGEDGKSQEVHSAKLEFLESIMEESSCPTLIFYHFKHSLERIKKCFPTAVVLDNDNIEAWRSGQIRMLLAHPQSWGAGANLQCNAGETVKIVWLDLPWSSESYTQGNARAWRQGQEKPVVIHHLMIKDTIDDRVKNVLEGKMNLQDAIMESLKL